MTISTTYDLAVTPFLEEECSFCLEEYKKTDEIHLLACQHFTHSTCIMSQNSCPLCRSKIDPIITEREKGYSFYEVIYRIVSENKEKSEWTQEEIEQQILKLRNALSQNHKWNHHAKINSFKDLCLLLQKPYSLKAEAYFMDLIQHPQYLRLDRYLQDQWSKLSPETADTDPVWNLISRLFSTTLCIPLQPNTD